MESRNSFWKGYAAYCYAGFRNGSSSWRASAYTGGTPGYGLYEDFPLPDDLLINEALTHQDQDDPGDWVEIYNS